MDEEKDDMELLKEWASGENDDKGKNSNKIYIASIGAIILAIVVYYFWKRSKEMTATKEKKKGKEGKN